MAAAPPLRRAAPSHAGLRQIGIFVLAYLVYFGVRAITQGSVAEATDNALGVIRFERELGFAWEGVLQDAVVRSGVLVDAANAVYMYGHWPVLIIGGFLLFRYRREQYFRLRDVCLLSGLIGLLVFAFFPVAPPRLTGLPLVDTVTQNAEGYRQLIPDSLVNEYAAIPSFHAGWNLLLGIVVFAATRNPLLRALSVLGPALMIAAVVLTANHFIVDVLVGVAIVLACLFVRDVVTRRRTTMLGSEERCDGPGSRRARGRTVPRRPPRRQRSHAAATGAGARRPAG